MKKITLIIGLMIGLFWLINTSVPVGYSNLGLPHSKPSSCQQSIENEVFIMQNAWNVQLNKIIDQEKPTSQKIDEAYESLNTYRCWLGYLCQATLYSGNSTGKNLKDRQLTREQVNVIPGCLPPEKLEIPHTKIKYLPLCKIEDSVSGKLDLIQQNFDACQQILNREFYQLKGKSLSDDAKANRQQSGAYIKLERLLRTSHANQKGRVLANKLKGITLKMHNMESHLTLLRESLSKFNGLLPCVINKCQ